MRVFFYFYGSLMQLDLIESNSKSNCQPFLRWAGGKSWLLKHLPGILRSTRYNRYHEPFLGGGSVFFFLPKAERTILSDVNSELINTYIQVRDNVSEVIRLLKTYHNSKKAYYEIRSQRLADPIEKSAQFIYLNQTSFNGIYRVNLDGNYNVPYGYRSKDFVQEAVLLTASSKLSNVQLVARQFDQDPDLIESKDLIFLDPPYTITHNDNGFIKYNEKLFSKEDQYRLATFIDTISQKGAYYILTNAAHQQIREIFHMTDPIRLTRNSLVGGKQAPRGSYPEYLFTNIKNDLS